LRFFPRTRSVKPSAAAVELSSYMIREAIYNYKAECLLRPS